MNQLLQEKRDAEQFLRLIAPKYMGVYILNRSTGRFRDVLAPEAFRAFAKVSEGLYSDAMRLYRDEYVSCDYREVIDQVLDYDYVYNVSVPEISCQSTPKEFDINPYPAEKLVL